MVSQTIWSEGKSDIDTKELFSRWEKNKTAYRLGSIFTWRYRNAVAAAIEKGMASRTDAPLFHFSDHPEADLRWRTFLSLLYVGFSALAWVATVLINQRMAHRQPQSARVVRQG